MDFNIWVRIEQEKAQAMELSELDYFKKLCFIKYQAIEILKNDLLNVLEDLNAENSERNGIKAARSIMGRWLAGIKE